MVEEVSGRVSVESFAAWAKIKPADGDYDFFNTHGCALYQFLTDIGAGVTWVGGLTWRDKHGEQHIIPHRFQEALAAIPWTFGALHARLTQAA